MRAPMCLLTVILAAGLGSCGGRPAKRSEHTGDTALAEPASAPATVVNQPTASVADEPRPDYIVHGVCPYECCKYGEWTMLEGGALRSAPTQGADSVGSVATGARVHTDSGVMVLSPPGIAVIAAADTSSAAGASGPQAGDTVEVISYTGQKVTRVLWQGQELERNSGLHMIRDPVQRWWVYITDPATLRGGWLQVGGVSAEVVGAPNACSKK